MCLMMPACSHLYSSYKKEVSTETNPKALNSSHQRPSNQMAFAEIAPHVLPWLLLSHLCWYAMLA